MPVDPEVRVAVEATGLTILGPVDDGLGHDGGLIVEAPLHNSAVRALAQRPGFSVSPSGLRHSVVWRQVWRTEPAWAEASARQDAGETMEQAGVFATLRDIADAEPVAPIVHPTDRVPDIGQLASTLKFALRCTMCQAIGATTEPTAREPLPPVEHLISCPWARVVQIVGHPADPLPAPEGGLVDAEIVCGATHPVIIGRDCDRPEGHDGGHSSFSLTWGGPSDG